MMEYYAAFKDVLNNFQAITGENQSAELHAQTGPVCE